jgi:hypothetical protein
MSFSFDVLDIGDIEIANILAVLDETEYRMPLFAEHA